MVLVEKWTEEVLYEYTERWTGVCSSRFHKIASFAFICGYLDGAERGGSSGCLGLISFIVLPEEWAEEGRLLLKSMSCKGGG